MKAIGIYYSKTGHTLMGLERVQKGLESCGVEVKLVDVRKATDRDLEGMNIVIIGSPVHGGNAAKPVRKFLEDLSEGSMSNKICSVISSAATGKTDRLMGYLSKRLEALGAEKIVPGVGYKAGAILSLFKGREMGEEAKKQCYELGITLTKLNG
jgi:flavodoxin